MSYNSKGDFDTVLNEFIEGLNKSEKTKYTYRRELGQFFDWIQTNYGDCTPNNLTRAEVQQYMDYLEGYGYSARSIAVKFGAISSFCKSTNQIGACNDIRRPKQARTMYPKALDKTERRKLIRDVERGHNKRDLAIVKTLLYTGVRVSELCALDISDIKLNDRSGWLKVRHGKGNREREIPVPVELRKALTDYLDDFEPEKKGDALFISTRGTRINVRTVEHMLKKYGTHPHALRHTYCTMLLSQGIDITSVARLAGHSDVNITAMYTQPTADDLEKAIKKAFGGD